MSIDPKIAVIVYLSKTIGVLITALTEGQKLTVETSKELIKIIEDGITEIELKCEKPN